jgi:uncharacterized protein (TIGR00369 family)
MTQRKAVRLSHYSARLGINYFCEPDGRVVGSGALGQEQEGPPGFVHGGVLTALLDEAMGAAAWCAGHRVVAANLNVDFRRPVALGADIHIVGRVEAVEGRKVYTSGEIYLADQAIAVTSRGLFIETPDLFDGYNPLQV